MKKKIKNLKTSSVLQRFLFIYNTILSYWSVEKIQKAKKQGLQS